QLHACLALFLSFHLHFFFKRPATPQLLTLSLHDALPISKADSMTLRDLVNALRETYCSSIGAEFMHISDPTAKRWIQERLESSRSEEHTSELQSRENLVCRLLLEKKKLARPAQCREEERK